MVQFLEVIGVQVGEESWAAWRMRRDFQIVNVRVPVRAHARIRRDRHRRNTIGDTDSMPRALDDLARGRFDLLVVGGGIHGLFAAYDAASRGLTVALVEGMDFGSGLSFNHQRTIHGGLRALEHGHLARSRQQIYERRAWGRIAPHLLRPLPFLVGTYRWTKRSRWLLKAGFYVYDQLGRQRNVDVSPELHLPKGRLESAAATKRLFPGIASKALTGGAIWYDYQTTQPDRLTWTVALAAEQAGARLVNYTSAVRPVRSGARIAGAEVTDHETGQSHTIEAAATVAGARLRRSPVMRASSAWFSFITTLNTRMK